MKELTYEFLKEFYLRSNVYGVLSEFNKQNFPADYEEMRKELEEMVKESEWVMIESIIYEVFYLCKNDALITRKLTGKEKWA